MKQPNFLSHFKSGLQPADKNRLAFQGGSYSPVSYTHLDVYKRQILHSFA